MNKINQYRTTYYKEVAAAFTVFFILFVVLATNYADTLDERTYVREETPITVEVTLSEKDVIIAKIKANFPRNGEVVVAIAKAESRLNPNAVGYNCYYNSDETKVYTTRVKGAHSTHCKRGHEKYSWSIDCGILQKNYVGLKSCPTVTIDEHLKEVAELSRSQGLSAWSAYNNESYKKFLTVK